MFQTLGDYLHSDHGYDETVVIDDDGNEVTCWHEDDSKYLAEVKYVKPSESGSFAEIHIDPLYYDERGEFVTERQLYVEWHKQLKFDSLDETFPEYKRSCCSKNGTLERVV